MFKKYRINTIPLINKNLDNIRTLVKDKSYKLDLAEVVYKFDCENCSFSYIGETKRDLKERLEVQVNIKGPKSVVSLYMNNEYKFDWENVSILEREKNYRKRIISEMLHFNSCKNKINKKEDTQFLN